MYNIKAAVSRLNFAPDTDEMKVTDIATGHFVFNPVPNRFNTEDDEQYRFGNELRANVDLEMW
ncbi:MAG: hypothetical protein GEV06_23480 [Luteitalea sp.]|nr:hypothetical protein [Luteitalea sp.]